MNINTKKSFILFKRFLKKFKLSIDKFKKFGIINLNSEDKVYFKSNNLNEVFCIYFTF